VFATVLKISKIPAMIAKTKIVRSIDKRLKSGKSKIKTKVFGIGIDEIMLKPKEVTAPIRKRPNKSRIEKANCNIARA
jgi:hypothetical protein